MRLVFVHGINQQGKDPEILKSTWIGDLEAGIGRPGALAGVDISMPFYGDNWPIFRASSLVAPSPKARTVP